MTELNQGERNTLQLVRNMDDLSARIAKSETPVISVSEVSFFEQAVKALQQAPDGNRIKRVITALGYNPADDLEVIKQYSTS